MKIYTLDEIERTRAEFEREKCEQVSHAIAGLHFRYYHLPPQWNTELPDFVVRMTSAPANQGHLFGISTSVNPMLRPYWVFHEVVEFLHLEPYQTHRCHGALQRELEVMPVELKMIHIPARKEFFKNMIDYAKKSSTDFDAADVQEFQKSLEELLTPF